MITLKSEVVTKEYDIGGYVIYVFKNLDNNPPFGYKYIMITRWPNWNDKDPEIGEIGYITYKEVVAGVDTWFDGTKFVPYNYTNLVYIKFVKEKLDNSKEIIL